MTAPTTPTITSRLFELALEQLPDAALEGASLREIAEVVGMSHAGVAKWLKG